MSRARLWSEVEAQPMPYRHGSRATTEAIHQLSISGTELQTGWLPVHLSGALAQAQFQR